MKKYVYFPYHVTSQYEKDVAARKNLSQVRWVSLIDIKVFELRCPFKLT